MNNLNNQKLEEIVEKTLDYLDGGKSPAEILNLFPEHRAMLKEIFFTINLLRKEGESIASSKELFKQVMAQIPDDVTNEVNSRYLYRGKINGRPSIPQSVNVVNLLLRMNKIYIGFGVILLLLIAGFGFYWKSQKTAVFSLVKQELAFEEKSFDDDIAEIKALGEDRSLDALDEDLAGVAEEIVPAVPVSPVSETKKIEIASIESLESELALEMSGFSDDFSELDGFQSDASFDNLDSGLSNAVE